MSLTERPSNCRNALKDAGKPYPKSGCAVCKNGGLTGCPYERHIAAGQPPKLAGALPLPPTNVPRYRQGGVQLYESATGDLCRFSDVAAYGDAREAAAAGVPRGWRDSIYKAIVRARVFDDGTDGADAETARSVVGILLPLVQSPPQPPAREAAVRAVAVYQIRQRQITESSAAWFDSTEGAYEVSPIDERRVLYTSPTPAADAGGVTPSAVRRAIMSSDLYGVLMDVQNGINSPGLASMANSAIRKIDAAREALTPEVHHGK